MINRIPVKIFREELICDDCKVKMKWDGATYLTNPPMYKHVCPKCNKTVTFNECYPNIVYLEYGER